MTIGTVINYLNQKKNYNLSADYYEKIAVWLDWWRGFHKPFHEFRETNGKRSVTRRLYSLRMAKKVCEDWASILLNEKTWIAITDGTEKPG